MLIDKEKKVNLTCKLQKYDIGQMDAERLANKEISQRRKSSIMVQKEKKEEKPKLNRAQYEEEMDR